SPRSSGTPKVSKRSGRRRIKARSGASWFTQRAKLAGVRAGGAPALRVRSLKTEIESKTRQPEGPRCRQRGRRCLANDLGACAGLYAPRGGPTLRWLALVAADAGGQHRSAAHTAFRTRRR